MDNWPEAADAAALASEDLTAAQTADAVATTKADTARKAAQPTLKQAAKTRDLADSQNDYPARWNRLATPHRMRSRQKSI